MTYAKNATKTSMPTRTKKSKEIFAFPLKVFCRKKKDIRDKAQLSSILL